MARSILTSHLPQEGYRKEIFFSLLGHGLLLLLFLGVSELFPATPLLSSGGKKGGGQGADFVSVGLAADPGGGTGLHKPSLTPRPEVLLPSPKKAEPKVPPKSDPDTFLKKSKAKKAKTAPSRAARSKKPKQEVKPGVIPGRPEAGTGLPRGGSSGSGGGLGGGQGVSIGLGAGENSVVDSWYARLVEQRIGSNWLKTSLGKLGRPAKTVVSFEIAPDGVIEKIRIQQSSGIRSVDLAAERAVRASSPLPRVPARFAGRRPRFVAHFEYPPR